MNKPLLNRYNFGTFDDEKFAIFDLREVPEGVPRSHHVESVLRTDAAGIEKQRKNAIDVFRKYGFYSISGNGGYSTTVVMFVVVPMDILRMRKPQLFGWSDHEILEMYQKAQQGEGMKTFPRDELDRVKKLWSENVTCGVAYSHKAEAERMADEKNKLAERFPCQGNYADALPNH